MKQTKCLRYIVAAFACASVAANAQPMVNYAEVPGRIFRGAALLDPFSNPAQPNIFFGGPAWDNDGCSVKLIAPGVPASACGDTDDGSVSAVGYDVTSGRLYAAGALAGWQVRSSGDGGGTWVLEDTFSLGGNSAAKGIAFDGAGNVFVSGYATDSAGDSHWIVRKRNSSGVWTPIRDWTERRKSYLADKAHVANGYLFVTGEAAGRWAVQRLNLNNNNNWDAPFIWAPKGKSAGANAVTTWGSDLYVLGWAGGYAEASEQCVLQRSSNYGTGPWQIVKTFAESPQINWPTDLTFDSHGNLYVIGQSTFYVANPANPRNGKYNSQWIVRTLAAGASAGNWQSWFPLPLSYDQMSYARRVCPDNFGNVYVLGQVDNYSGSTFSSRNVLVQKWTLP